MARSIERLEDSHDVSSFVCEGPDQIEFLRDRARVLQQLGFAQTFVTTQGSVAVAGFYSLNMFAIELTWLPDELRKQAPYLTKAPVLLLGQLARHRQAERGTGEALLVDALRRMLAIADDCGCVGMVLHVDSRKSKLVAWYERLGFSHIGHTPTPQKPNATLFLPTATARAATAAT